LVFLQCLWFMKNYCDAAEECKGWDLRNNTLC